jgi:hypothetical protein
MHQSYARQPSASKPLPATQVTIFITYDRDDYDIRIDPDTPPCNDKGGWLT